MVKYFSVDWLAESHHHSGATSTESRAGPTHRPHIPCMVQPSAPTFGKSYLQPKPKLSQPRRHAEVQDVGAHRESSLCASSQPATCASPISEVSGYSSGYESEAASSDCLTVEEGSEGEKDGPQRRVRTKFTPGQINKLEEIFNKHKYLDAAERVKTARRLKLTETQVRTWFQNRRMKLKREVQDYITPRIPQVTLQPLYPVQYHAMAVQQPPYTAACRGLYQLPVPQLVLQQQMSPHYRQHPMMPHSHFS